MRLALELRTRICLLILPLLATVGCGTTLETFAPIEGTLTQGGKPIAEASIVLHPQESQLADLPKPIATTDETGNFKVTTLSTNDGALPGKYAITVALRAPRQSGEETIRDGQLLLPVRFADPATSGLMKDVVPGENHWEPIDIPLR